MKFKKDNFIGIFDSGIGGISVLNSCIKLMPYENFVYFADSENFPYGKKSINELEGIGLNVISRLYNMGSKEIIIACNTMSTNNIKTFKQEFKDINIIGTFPNFTTIFNNNITLSDRYISFDKANGLKISNKKIKLLIIATTATTRSEYLHNLVEQLEDYIDIYIEATDFIVKAVENNYLDSENFINELDVFFKEYKDIDYILLGCTHFAFAIDKLKMFINEDVKLLSGGEITANDAYTSLHNNNLLNDNSNPFIKIVDYNLSDNKIQLYNKLLKTSTHSIQYCKELT